MTTLEELLTKAVDLDVSDVTLSVEGGVFVARYGYGHKHYGPTVEHAVTSLVAERTARKNIEANGEDAFDRATAPGTF